MLIIFFIYILTFLFFLCLLSLFLFLLLRKLVLQYLVSRNEQYEAYIFPKISRYVTLIEDEQDRLFRFTKPWQRRIVLRLLLKIAVNVQDGSEVKRIGQVCELLGLKEHLSRQLQDKRRWVVAEALRQIGILRLREFFPQVEHHLHSGHYDVWTAAARTLTQLGFNQVLIQYLTLHHEKLKRESVIRMADMLRDAADDDVDLMLAHLQEVSPLLQGLFIDLFGQAKAIKALPMLESYLSSDQEEHRIKAMKAIAEIGITSKQDQVLHGLQSSHWVERLQAIRIVRACAIHTAVPQLVKLLADPEWWVRYHAANALYNFGTAGKERLREAGLYHQDPYARDMAKQILNG